MNLLFTLNENYLEPFFTALRSIFHSNDKEKMTIYLMHQNIPQTRIIEVEQFVTGNGHAFFPVDCKNLFSEEAVVNRYYSIEMYYRLLAPFVLPIEIDRILYLDPDIINLRSFSTFYKQDFEGKLFVATTHDYATKWIQPINNIRLGTLSSEDYFNTGVILMNLTLIRSTRNLEEIITAIKNNKNRLVLPDQDIFNHLYWNEVKEAEWRIYNLDARFYSQLKRVFPRKFSIEWVEEKVVFIHYCGKHKPWIERESYRYELGSYYHYFEDILKQENELNLMIEDNE
ncbi:glycosyltransferase family 8 protein [Carnobacterium viridans]|uniref:Lipopolysaccharide biosynthesis protein, LPS:glycosyltransferase n=1 Tax=Carnobacterium viridans TaxID=174587 RepID=A0A1H0YY78_9LACT|nr:glycosyltransferase family 8 protein [Carnobacterium viridans]UDE94885.1 glycosyltransferase family 8 protein [Carnobacterium viridans]SDQ20133.1 Lipopolysaccharide biosynthesis protein, LPS:glycosyltransferase [Carnobacterium viridans]